MNSKQIRRPQRPSRRPSSRRATRPTSRRTRRRGCLLPLLALALVLCLGGTLAYLLLMLPAPTNILILGIDRRPEESDATRSDTIILLHSDLGGSRVALLSIPRDLWVTIPGWGEERINAAHLYGELDSPGGGPALAAATVNYNFGLPIHHTLRLDFDAFRQVIDAAGGIEIDVPAPIVDDAYPTQDYGVMRIEIPAGRQHMDGNTALQYARSRHSSSDFDRAARQQQILVALAKKMSTPSGLLRASRVYRALQNAVETDLSLRDLSRLALAWWRAGDGGLEQIVIDWSLTTSYRTDQGAIVLLPQWDLINPLLKQHFK